MWYLPLRVTLEVKRTRTSSSLIIRVQFIYQERGTGESPFLAPET